MAKSFPCVSRVDGKRTFGQRNTNGDDILGKVGSGLGNQRLAQNTEQLDEACFVAKKVGQKGSTNRVLSGTANKGELLLSRNTLRKNGKKLLASVGLAGKRFGHGKSTTSGSGNALGNTFIMRLKRRSPRR